MRMKYDPSIPIHKLQLARLCAFPKQQSEQVWPIEKRMIYNPALRCSPKMLPLDAPPKMLQVCKNVWRNGGIGRRCMREMCCVCCSHLVRFRSASVSRPLHLGALLVPNGRPSGDAQLLRAAQHLPLQRGLSRRTSRYTHHLHTPY